MTLGTFQPRARVQGDQVDYEKYLGRPLLVRVMEFVPDFVSQRFPNPKPTIFADVVDLFSGQIFINVLWGSGAVVDNLKDHTGSNQALPVQLVQRVSKTGNKYFTLDALDAQTTANAGIWYEQNWHAVDAERARREQAANAAPPQQAPVQQAPVQQAPVQQGFGAPAQAAPAAYAQQAPVQQGFGAPVQQAPAAQGFGGGAVQAPVQQGFGAPAQAPVQQAPQGFGAPAGGGMFSDTPPAPAQGQGFGAPQGVDPAVAQQALQNLNGQLAQG